MAKKMMFLFNWNLELMMVGKNKQRNICRKLLINRMKILRSRLIWYSRCWVSCRKIRALCSFSLRKGKLLLIILCIMKILLGNLAKKSINYTHLLDQNFNLAVFSKVNSLKINKSNPLSNPYIPKLKFF